jgi:hypothetical protein
VKSSMTLAGGANSFSQPQNLLEQKGPSSPGKRALTPVQAEVDGLVGSFASQATDWKTLVPILAGGMASRLSRMGMMSLCGGKTMSLLRPFSWSLGLLTESAVFEAGHRGLFPLMGEESHNPNLWNWSGKGGLREGWISSIVTFGAFKTFGRLTEGQNPILQHGSQAAGMVLGHQLAHRVGLGPRPSGTLAEQFLRAEAMNLQLSAGMGLIHHMAPAIAAVERGMDLGLRESQVSSTPFFQQPVPAAAVFFPEQASFYKPPFRGFSKNTMAMSSFDEGEGPARVSRTIPPSAPSKGSKEFPYELRIEDFSNFLNIGHQSVIAVREGREFWVQLGHREKTKHYDRYFPAGTPKLYFRLKEGKTLGRAVVYLENDAINLYSIVTKDRKIVRTMSPGAGTIFLDWLATQAALQGKDFNIIRVEEPRIFHILSRNQLVEPENTIIEACLWTKEGYRVHTVDNWGNRKLIDLYEDGRFSFLNIRARPNRSLIPPPPSEPSN